MNALQLISVNEELATGPDIVIVPTTAAHIRELNRTLREKDRKEIENYGWLSGKALWRCYKQGLNNQTALIDGCVAACWGILGSYLGNVGEPWLLTSNQVYKISPLKFARIYQKEVYRMLDFFPRLESGVCASYSEAIRLLSIIGFKVSEPELAGHGMFCRFTMRRAD